MVIQFEKHLDALFLNDIEDRENPFNADFLDRAIDRCLPLLPDEYFDGHQHQKDLRSFLTDFFGL